MKYNLLGQTGVSVSELCFGTMSFGGIADEAESKAMFNRCMDAGINFYDCANVYQRGVAEKILGKFISGIREELVITTKFTASMGDEHNQGGSSRRHMKLQVEDSLKRLGTDWIDVYFVHMYDPATPIEEVVRGLDDLVREGKILYPAISNWSAWQMMKALGIADAKNLTRITTIQPMYNLVKRQAEVEIFPMAQSEGLAVIPYSPLGGGFLTGKYSTANKPDVGRIVENQGYSVRYGMPLYWEIAEKFTAHANEKGVHPATLAVAWANAHPAVTAPIIGARNLEQLESSLAAVDVDMTPEWYDEIAALSYTPPPAHDRLEEA